MHEQASRFAASRLALSLTIPAAGTGAVFSFTFPVAVLANWEPQADPAAEVKEKHVSDQWGRASEPLHVLVVEDNMLSQTVLRRQLELQDHKVSTADNGLEALIMCAKAQGIDPLHAFAEWLPEGVDIGAHIRQCRDRLAEMPHRPVDVVLMDLWMPEMDGYECVRTLRKHADFENLPIVSAYSRNCPWVVGTRSWD